MTILIYLIMISIIVYFAFKKYRSMTPDQLREAKRLNYINQMNKKARKRERRDTMWNTIFIWDLLHRK